MADTVQLPLRVLPTLKRSVEECARIRGFSVNDEAGLLLQRALLAERKELGLGDGDPLEITAERLEAHSVTWSDEFSGAEVDAIATTRLALQRIAEKRSRESR